jgi:hypothetical protein
VELTDSWEIELPHVPFSFEFDPRLTTEALYAQTDDDRTRSINSAVRLEPVTAADSGAPCFLHLNEEMALRDPPAIVVTTPIPCDLAHAATLEIEGVPGRFRSTDVVVSGQGEARPAEASRSSYPLGPIPPIPANSIERPGPRRIRAILSPDPDLGWADPDVRAIWPAEITTGWLDVEIVRK